MSWEIKQGDWIDVLRTLPDESVHCVVTSPPYWGLRDYGTGTWEGGKSDCDHIEQNIRIRRNLAAAAEASDGCPRTQANRKDDGGIDLAFRQVCGKCGAARVDRQLGLERTPDEYVAKMVEGFREVRRALRKDGTLWLNLGDSYANDGKWGGATGGKHAADLHGEPVGRAKRDTGLKPKDLVGIPWMVAFALRADGWYLRQDVIWAKPNPMPESVTDRCTKSHEYLFLLSKSERYYFDAEAIKEPNSPGSAGNRNAFRGDGVYTNNHSYENSSEVPPTVTRGMANEWTGRNKRSVWEIATSPFPEAHFATFPPKLVEPCILAVTSERGCCPKCGAPWKRLVEPDEQRAATLGTGYHDHENDLGRGQRNGKPAIGGYRTLGWSPSCACAAPDPVSCTVLDPFAGAGTTGLVATRLYRNFIGIELNPQYIALASRRIEQDAPLFNTAEAR